VIVPTTLIKVSGSEDRVEETGGASSDKAEKGRFDLFG